jgi:hypothetical protein
LDLDGKLEGGKRFISMKEVQFLDEWEGDPGLEEQHEDEIVNSALAQREPKRMPARASSAASSLPSIGRRPVSTASKASAANTSSGAMTVVKGGYPDPAASGNTKEFLAEKAKAKERVHRTYGVPNATRKTNLQKSRSLPWLKKIMNLDDKMRATINS